MTATRRGARGRSVGVSTAKSKAGRDRFEAAAKLVQNLCPEADIAGCRAGELGHGLPFVRLRLAEGRGVVVRGDGCDAGSAHGDRWDGRCVHV